ncbi:hypothetical protein GFS60_01317 [Rhodococcus sp. WAY2]|nr:hypothetical protein GFS60_01317 [Rhodococcus sp. WAY2]
MVMAGLGFARHAVTHGKPAAAVVIRGRAQATTSPPQPSKSGARVL